MFFKLRGVNRKSDRLKRGSHDLFLEIFRQKNITHHKTMAIKHDEPPENYDVKQQNHNEIIFKIRDSDCINRG